MKKWAKILACILSVCALSVSVVSCSEEETPSWLEQLTCNHEWNEGEVTREPTCTKEGKLTITCEKCDKTKTEKVAKAEHNEIILITRPALCTENGEHLYECNDCGELRKEVIEAPGHDAVKIMGTAATCETEGLTDGTFCEVCGEWVKEQETLEKLDHEYGEDNVCDDCGAEKTES